MATTQPLSSDIQRSSTPIPMKNYHMTYTTSRTNVELHLDSLSGPIVYYMESFILTSKLALRSTRTSSDLPTPASKSSPMVAFAKLSSLTGKHNGIGLGDFQKGSEGALVYEEFTREKNILKRSDYTFTAAVEYSTQRRKYTWKKDMKEKISTSYECVDEDGQVVGKMYSGGAFNWRNAGSIEVTESAEKGLEELLIISALSIWTIEGLSGWSMVKAERKEDQKDVDAGHSHAE